MSTKKKTKRPAGGPRRGSAAWLLYASARLARRAAKAHGFTAAAALLGAATEAYRAALGR